MAELTPRQIAEKQVARARASTQSYKDGVRRPRKDPMKAAIEKLQKMHDNWIKAYDDGKIKAGFERVTLDDWITATADKGGDRWAKGIEASLEKTAAFQEQFTPFRRAVRDRVRNMPDLTEEDRDNRMLANSRGLREFRYRRVGPRRA